MCGSGLRCRRWAWPAEPPRGGLGLGGSIRIMARVTGSTAAGGGESVQASPPSEAAAPAAAALRALAALRVFGRVEGPDRG